MDRKRMWLLIVAGRVKGTSSGGVQRIELTVVQIHDQAGEAHCARVASKAKGFRAVGGLD